MPIYVQLIFTQPNTDVHISITKTIAVLRFNRLSYVCIVHFFIVCDQINVTQVMQFSAYLTRVSALALKNYLPLRLSYMVWNFERPNTQDHTNAQ